MTPAAPTQDISPPNYPNSPAKEPYLSSHPKTKGAAIGTGVGMAKGAMTGLLTGQGLVRGALIGAGTGAGIGAGIGLVSSAQTMQRNQIGRNVVAGSAAGWGLTLAGRRAPWSLQAANRGAIVGETVGLAAGLIRDGLK